MVNYQGEPRVDCWYGSTVPNHHWSQFTSIYQPSTVELMEDETSGSIYIDLHPRDSVLIQVFKQLMRSWCCSPRVSADLREYFDAHRTEYSPGLFQQRFTGHGKLGDSPCKQVSQLGLLPRLTCQGLGCIQSAAQVQQPNDGVRGSLSATTKQFD